MLFLASSAYAAAAVIDKDTVDMVEAFLKMPTADLPPAHIERFLSIEAESLPPKLRRKFAAKKLELYTLRELAGQKKRGYVRMPEDNCEPPSETATSDDGLLKLAGYVEITHPEVVHLTEKTQCTVQDLTCEFTLRIVSIRDPKTKKAVLRYYLHGRDPLMVFVGEYRAGFKKGNVTVFSGSGFSCTPHLKK